MGDLMSDSDIEFKLSFECRGRRLYSFVGRMSIYCSALPYRLQLPIEMFYKLGIRVTVLCNFLTWVELPVNCTAFSSALAAGSGELHDPRVAAQDAKLSIELSATGPGLGAQASSQAACR